MNVILAIIMALFQFLPIVGSGNAQATGKALAQQVTYTVYTVPNSENKSVLISIPIEEEQYLQLYSPQVLKAFTSAALELQKESIPADAGDVTFLLMNANHIAGEARLHLIGYVFTYLAGGENGLFANEFNRFRVIDLNVDEARVPPFIINLTGWFANLGS